MKRIFLLWTAFAAIASSALANNILIPMDEKQKNHLKAYGIAYWILNCNQEVDWLLNYRGGSFMCGYQPAIQQELTIRGVSYEMLSGADANSIIAEIPYDVIFDEEVMRDELPKYDWLHLHHEDFTGQYGKFYRNYAHAPWYLEQKHEAEDMAKKLGFYKVSQMKLAVAKKIKEFVAAGGFLFAMCSATDSFDIALAAEGIDICEKMYDGDPADYQAQSKLDFEKTFAFANFRLSMDPYEYEFSNIDNNVQERPVNPEADYFTLFQFSAKWDPVPTMLTQNHVRIIKGFYGQTTGFKKQLIKSDVVVMGEEKEISEVKYLHGIFGKGFWTFYGGHDPEDYQHIVGEDPTDLHLHPNSPGYRLILNNILFPADKKKKQKT